MFTSAKLMVAFFLLGWVNSVFKGDLFTHARRPLPCSVPGFPLPSVLSAAYGKMFTDQLCKQTVSSLLLPCLTHQHNASDIGPHLLMLRRNVRRSECQRRRNDDDEKDGSGIQENFQNQRVMINLAAENDHRQLRRTRTHCLKA